MFSQPRWQQLPSVAECSDEEILLDKDSRPGSPPMNPTTRAPRPQNRLLHGCLLVISHVLILILGLWLARHLTNNVDIMQCVKATNHDSPIFRDLDIKYHTVRYNGSFLHENAYRQRAGPEVDAAWQALGVDYRAMRIPNDVASIAGIKPTQVQIKEKYGGGGFPANLEGLHHLHCLDLLRKALYWNYEHYKDLGKGAFINDDFIVEKHVTHCLDILRQQLMCTVDVGLLGQVWWNRGPDGPYPFVDFNTVHVCRNFDDIRRWAEERQLGGEEPRDFLVQPDPKDVLWEIP